MECVGVSRLRWANIFCVAFSCGTGCALDLLLQKDAAAIPGRKGKLVFWFCERLRGGYLRNKLEKLLFEVFSPFFYALNYSLFDR